MISPNRHNYKIVYNFDIEVKAYDGNPSETFDIWKNEKHQRYAKEIENHLNLSSPGKWKRIGGTFFVSDLDDVIKIKFVFSNLLSYAEEEALL